MYFIEEMNSSYSCVTVVSNLCNIHIHVACGSLNRSITEREEKGDQRLLLTTFLLVYKGCQFHPIGEYLKFVRVPENLGIGEEVIHFEAYPRSHLEIVSVDKVLFSGTQKLYE